MSKGHPIFAFLYPVFGWVSERLGFGDQRRKLLAHAEGRVVEIGAGTGLNFRHYPPGLEIVATEPDLHMLRRAAKAARRVPVRVTVQQAGAESLPFEDSSVDTIVATLVLCSVPDQTAVLAEAKRVLKPGGKLLFLEHVRSRDGALARIQDKREALQVRMAGGCHPNRDTLGAIVATGFEPEIVEHRDFPGPKITRPGLWGVARKPTPNSRV